MLRLPSASLMRGAWRSVVLTQGSELVRPTCAVVSDSRRTFAFWRDHKYTYDHIPDPFHGHAHYRQRPGYDGQKAHNWKLIAMTFLWWWVFYGIWTDPGHVFGHSQFQPPDPRKWSDKELGIPQD